MFNMLRDLCLVVQSGSQTNKSGKIDLRALFSAER